MDGDDLLPEHELARLMADALRRGLCVNCRTNPLRSHNPGVRFCAECVAGKGFHPTEPGLAH